jgi:hypothetical protein
MKTPLTDSFVAGVAFLTICNAVTTVFAAPIMFIYLPLRLWNQPFDTYCSCVRVVDPPRMESKPVIESCRPHTPFTSPVMRALHPFPVVGVETARGHIQTKYLEEEVPLHWSTIRSKDMTTISPGAYAREPSLL